MAHRAVSLKAARPINFMRLCYRTRRVLPESFPRDFKDEVRAFGAEVIEVHEPMEICSGVHSTGELGSGIKEQFCLQPHSPMILIKTRFLRRPSNSP